ncbi:hypothetical protein D3C73_1336630 [compost metagenome]
MAITDWAFCRPLATTSVPSRGSTATSTEGPCLLPTFSPMYSMGASSISPSPITTVPSMETESNMERMAVVAALSAASLSPRPIQLAEAKAPSSVTRTISRASSRSIVYIPSSPFLTNL